MYRKEQGFTLIELMIVVAIIAIIAAVAVPNLLSAKLAANESNAISTLRNLTSAQAQFQSIGAIDEDTDGTGEYGCFGELSGVTPLNNRGIGPATPLDPPILASSFRQPNAAGIVPKSGYNFLVYLPDGLGAGTVETGGPALPVANAGVDTDNCEIVWSAYAWPVDAGTTGNRAFFVNHRGEIIQTRMDVFIHTGAVVPLWQHALAAAAVDMSDNIAIATAIVGGDGNQWTPVQ